MKLADRRDFLKLGVAAAAGCSLVTGLRPASAVEPPAPGATASQRIADIADSGALSGLTWNSGAFSNVDKLAAFRRRPLDLYGSFVSHSTWSQILGFPYNTNFPNFSKLPIWISLGYPLIPKNIGAISSTKWTQLATPGNAVFDDFYAKHERLTQNIGTVMRSPQRKCRGLVARVGWEFNGSQAWELNDYGKAAEYCSVFRRLVAILRRNVPGVLIDWNVCRAGTQKSLPIERIYPGDDVVDIVSICHYDRLPSFNTHAIWDAQYNRLDRWGNPWGIGARLAFAKRHGKKFAVPEWALANGMKYAEASKDNPLYMELMFNFFKENAADIAYESYFNTVYYHQIVPSIRNPKGAAAYRSLYSL